MTNKEFLVAPDIKKAQTIAKEIYTSQNVFEEEKKNVFESSWQLLADLDAVKIPGQYSVVKFLDPIIEEPILFTRDLNDEIHCLSNVCTHRGTILAETSGHTTKHLRCRYHGRRFNLNGSFHSMPEMDEAENFPSVSDSLPKIPFKIWKKFLFTSLQPSVDFSKFIQPMETRVGFLPFNEFIFDQTRSRDYLVQANWALYVENYLEGFHIPYIHPSLAKALDYNNYRTELFEHGNLQIGVSSGSENIFDLPKEHKDYSQQIAAYYFWLFPNLMMNFYPWGLSINIVKPLAVDKTKVSYQTYIWKEELLDLGAGAGLDKVEREDEAVVEQVQKGVKSKFYNNGRYSPTREQGVHHFHRLLAQFLAKN